MEKSVRSETTRPPHNNNNNNNSSVAYLFNKSYIAWPAPLGGSSRLVCALKKILVHPWEKKGKKEKFCGAGSKSTPWQPASCWWKNSDNFFFWPTKFSFSPRAPLNLYSPQPNLFLLGYLALSDCLTPREFKQWVDSLSLSLEFLFYIPHKCWFVARAALDWCSNWQMINTDARRRRVVQILAHYLCTSALFLSHLLCLVIHQLIGCARHFDETDVPLLPLSNDLFFHCLTLSTVSVETRWHLLRLFTLAPLPHCVNVKLMGALHKR